MDVPSDTDEGVLEEFTEADSDTEATPPNDTPDSADEVGGDAAGRLWVHVAASGEGSPGLYGNDCLTNMANGVKYGKMRVLSSIQ